MKAKFALDLILMEGLHKTLWALKVVRASILEISRSWPNTKNTIRGRWWLPPSPGRGESYESVYAYGLSVHQKCYNYVLTNLLFGLCGPM